MLLAVLLGPGLAVTATSVMAGLIGVMAGGSLEMTIYMAAGGLVAILVLGRIERVNAFFFAGLYVALINIAVVLAFRLPTGTTDPIGLGILTPPGDYGADVVVAEGQSLGIPLSYGGPYLGIFATKNAYVRKMAGRLVGETIDADGKRGYVLTLSTREQHIRREKATSNICTNQGLAMTAATIYLSLLGAEGLERVALASHNNIRELAQATSKLGGIARPFNRPVFHEKVIRLDKPVAPVLAHMAANGILGGLDLAPYYPELGDALLVCATETKTAGDIDRYVKALDKALLET